MIRRPLSEMPRDHSRFRGAFEGVTEDGQTFRLEVRNSKKRMNSGEIVRAHMQAQSRGRPMASMYKDTIEITLYVPGHHRRDIEILPSGMYRQGRHVDRTLPGVVECVLDEMRPRSAPSP